MKIVLGIFLLASLSLSAMAETALPLYTSLSSLELSFNIRDPHLGAAKRTKLANSAALFKLIQEKGEAFWIAADGKHACFQPDGGSPVPEHFIKEAKAYGYELVSDEGRKICGSFTRQ